MADTSTSMPYREARERAEAIRATLATHCVQIEIAGSIRRHKPRVGDIEIVCQPHPEVDLLKEPQPFHTAGFVAAVRGRKRVVWPDGTHSKEGGADLFGTKRKWRGARECIDWSIKGMDLRDRQKPLRPRTLDRIEAGLRKFGGEAFIVVLRGTNPAQRGAWAKSLDEPLGTISASGAHHGLCEPFIVQVAHTKGNRVRSVEQPLPAIPAGHRGELAVCEPFIIPMEHSGAGALRSVSEALPTITTARGGAFGLCEPFLTSYYGTGKGAHSLDEPLDTITTKGRFALVEPYRYGLRFRMLQPHELAAGQGFPSGYWFDGNKTDAVRQIGNAVPCGMAGAIVAAAVSQNAAAWRKILEVA